MRAYAIVAALAGSIGVAACSTNVNMGGKIKTTSSALAGDPCSQGSDCPSGLCLGQICCAVGSCGTDPNCQGTSCNSSGACVYPTGMCGTHCFLGYLTPSMCSFGDCTSRNDAPCPGHLACANDAACRDSCAQTSDCADGYYCSSGSCLAQEFPGIGCASNDVCRTGICGVAGSGHCCTQACVTGDPGGCGASDCDAVGDCIYPPVTTSCVPQSCTGHELTKRASCNGAGTCAIPTPTTSDCAPYSCGASGGCNTSCGGSADCWNAFCSSSASVCCPFYPGNTIDVDGTQGVDQACCGSGTGASACATIAHAASLASDTGVMPMTLAVANPPNGKDWVADQFPIALGQGLVLRAPGLYFAASNLDGGPPLELLLVFNPASVASPVPTVIEGSAGTPIHLGFDSLGNPTQSNDPNNFQEDILDIEHGALNLCDAEIHSPGVGIRMGGPPSLCDACKSDATLTLGSDGLGASGTVWIGAPDAGQGVLGIYCFANPGVISDTGSTAAPSVWIQNMRLGIETSGSVNLTSSPRFGLALNDDGGCDSMPDLGEVQVYFGGANSGAVISGATFECGVYGLESNTGFTGDHDQFLSNLIGVNLFSYSDISSSITNSIFRNNSSGIEVFGSAPVDLSHGNEISCNDATWASGFPAIGLETYLSAHDSSNVNAENILWDRWNPDAGHTQTWTCGADGQAAIQLSTCTCSGGPDCPPDSDGGLPTRVGVLLLLFSDGGPPYSVGPDAGPPYYIDDVNGALAPDGCP